MPDTIGDQAAWRGSLPALSPPVRAELQIPVLGQKQIKQGPSSFSGVKSPWVLKSPGFGVGPGFKSLIRLEACQIAVVHVCGMRVDVPAHALRRVVMTDKDSGCLLPGAHCRHVYHTAHSLLSAMQVSGCTVVQGGLGHGR